MTWYPLGPAHVFFPRSASYARISRQNEHGAQGTVVSIAFRPGLRDHILVVDRPDSGGRGLWRTVDGGLSWSPALDGVHAAAGPEYGPGVDPTCVVYHPNVPARAYFASGRKRSLYRSVDDGRTWTFVHELAGSVRSLVINPRTGLDAVGVGSTEIFALVAETGAGPDVNGLWVSPDDGASFTQVLAGDVDSFAPLFPPAPAAADIYAFVRFQGLYHSTTPGAAGSYTAVPTGPALAPGASGPLPSPVAGVGSYDRLRLARSFSEPGRVWGWASRSDSTQAIYRREPGGAWTRIVTSGEVPHPWQGARNYVFAAAPYLPPGAVHEPLFFGGSWMYRSIDGGATWEEADPGHADVHAIAFRPAAGGGAPEVWVGTDGGVAYSTRYADGSPIPASPSRNEGAMLDPASPAIRPMNRGKAGSAAFQLAVPPGARTLTYLGCQDTGIAVGGGSRTWRSAMPADAGALAAAPGPDGMRVWAIGGFNISIPWPPFNLRLSVDTGTSLSTVDVHRLGTGSLVPTTSNYVLDGVDACLAGGISRDDVRHLASPADPSPADPVWITLDSVAGIQLGSWVTVNPAVEEQETARVLAVDAAASRVQIHRLFRHYDPPMAVALNEAFVLRADAAGRATVISPSLAGGAHLIRAIAIQPGSGVALAGTRRSWYLGGSMDPSTDFDEGLPADPEFDRPRVFRTAGGVSGLTPWTLVEGNRPTGAAKVSSVAVTPGGTGFVLLQEPVPGTAADGALATTPLFRIDASSWTALPASGLPSGFPFGKLLADPAVEDRLYASCGGHVYAISPGAAGVWAWTPLSTGEGGLPGDAIVDLAIVSLGPPGSPRALLRAATGSRGVWESEIMPGALPPASQIYLRDNYLDDGWLLPSPAGVPSPLHPAESVWWWQSPDIRVETSQPGPAGSFYQTDPEGSAGRLPHTIFNLIRDFSLSLEQGRDARIHVQVHNRSRVPATARVLVLATRAAAGVPDLDLLDDGTTFPFWSRFHADGTIDLADWPTTSVWAPVGGADEVPGIDAWEPGVSGRFWTVPPLSQGEHRCLIAIAHSAANPAGAVTASTHVDSITRFHRGFAQKNLHIVAMRQEPGPRPDVEGAPSTLAAAGLSGAWTSKPFEVDFHAPEDRIADLVFDLRGLPPGLRARIELPAGVVPTKVENARPASSQAASGRGCLGLLRALLGWGKPAAPSGKPGLWSAEPGAAAVLGGIRIGKRQRVTVRLALEGAGTLAAGEEHRLDVLQRAKGEVVGGSSYVVRVGTERPRPVEEPEDEPEKANRFTRLAPLLLCAPWMEDEVEARLRERGRMPGS